MIKTISGIVEPHADGSLHLPLPTELQHRKVWIEARLQAADDAPVAQQATSEMLSQRKNALASLRSMGGLKDVIPDPLAWQREMREDRLLGDDR